MLKGEYRLKKGKDIDRVYTQGKSGQNNFIYVKARYNNLNNSRAAIVVGGKVSKKATVRNLIRRRVSSQLELLWQTVQPKYDIVITIRGDMSKLAIGEIKKQLLASLKACGVIT